MFLKSILKESIILKLGGKNYIFFLEAPIHFSKAYMFEKLHYQKAPNVLVNLSNTKFKQRKNRTQRSPGSCQLQEAESLFAFY